MTDWPPIENGLGKLTSDRWDRIGDSVEETELGGPGDERSQTQETSHPTGVKHRTHFSAAITAYAQILATDDFVPRPNMWCYAFREVRWKGVQASVDIGDGTLKQVVLPRPYYIPNGNHSYIKIGEPDEDGVWNRFGRPAWNRAEVRNVDFQGSAVTIASGGINMVGVSYPEGFFLQPIRAGKWNDDAGGIAVPDPGAFGSWPASACPVVEMTMEMTHEGYQIALFDWPNQHDGNCTP